MNIANFRKNLIELINGGSAHVDWQQAIAEVNPEIRHFRPSPHLHSIYEELEHMRIAQEDILRYTLEEGWESPPWPYGYWPEPQTKVSDEQWNTTIRGFGRDIQSLTDLINDKAIDLTDEIPHGEGRTYLREILLVADHNAYHLGKIIDIRKQLGDW